MKTQRKLVGVEKLQNVFILKEKKGVKEVLPIASHNELTYLLRGGEISEDPSPTPYATLGSPKWGMLFSPSPQGHTELDFRNPDPEFVMDYQYSNMTLHLLHSDRWTFTDIFLLTYRYLKMTSYLQMNSKDRWKSSVNLKSSVNMKLPV